MSTPSRITRFSLGDLRRLHEQREKLVMLTCYDASFAAMAEVAGVEILLVGDSLGMVVQGHDTTLPVTLADTVYHVSAVARGTQKLMIVADMPFGTYQRDREQAFANAVPMMAAGAHMVKIEGGRIMHETARFLVDRGVPVCGHIGLTPQSVHQFGGFRVQGRGDQARRQLIEEAKLLEAAGAAMIVLEAIPADLAREVTDAIAIPTIGIGAGPDCSGQVLVLYDMLGIYPGRKPKFVRNFMDGAPSIRAAVELYVREVKAVRFPGPEHIFAG